MCRFTPSDLYEPDGGPTAEEREGPSLLADLTEMTGGRMFPVHDLNDLPDIATKISMELRNQYVFGIQTQRPRHDGKWRKIKVKLRPPKGLPPLNVYAQNRLLRAGPLTLSGSLRQSSVLLAIALLAGPCVRGPAIAPRRSPSTSASRSRRSRSHSIKQNVDLVVLHVTVTDGKGNFVPGLQKNNFKVFEDKVEQKHLRFSAGRHSVTMGLVIDNSGSMREKRAQVNAAALTFVRPATRRTKFSS